jgi:hypothetical protein
LSCLHHPICQQWLSHCRAPPASPLDLGTLIFIWPQELLYNINQARLLEKLTTPSQSLNTYHLPDNMGEETEVADAVPQVAFKKRSKGKANFRKKPSTPPPASDSGSDFESSDDGEGQRIKRRRKNAAVTASSTSNATRTRTAEEPTTAAPAPLTSSNDATKHSDWYDENLTARNLLGTTRTRPAASTSEPDGSYKGAANYQSFIQKNPDAPGKFGPIKAPTNVRTVTVTDFAPDVCKDWKQTGYVSDALPLDCFVPQRLTS